MKYTLEDIVMINPNYSQVKDNKFERVICSLNGAIKILNCNPAILDEVLDCIDDNNTFKDVQDILAKKYPINDVINFLQTLVDEEILISKQNSISIFRDKSNDILVIGNGKIFESFKKFDVDIIGLDDFFDSDFENNYNYIIVAPEQISYKDMIEINRKLYQKKKNYIPVYFDGEKIVFGPLIIPEKTLCLECIVSHELKLLNKNIDRENQVKLESVLNLKFSNYLNNEFSDYVINYIVSIILEDIESFKGGKGSRLLDNQFTYKKTEIGFNNEELLPTTYCDFCHGMNKNYLSFKGEMEVENLLNGNFNVNKTLFKNNPIKYKIGGFRSKSEEETKKILEEELEKFGTKITIEEGILG